MGLEQDYIMKMIEQLINFLVKKIFKFKSKDELESLDADYEKNNEVYKKLKNMIDEGKINEAENELFDNIDSKNEEGLKLALVFYNYLNSKSTQYLEENNFSKEEVKEGLRDVVKMYGYEDFANLFLS